MGIRFISDSSRGALATEQLNSRDEEEPPELRAACFLELPAVAVTGSSPSLACPSPLPGAPPQPQIPVGEQRWLLPRSPGEGKAPTC